MQSNGSRQCWVHPVRQKPEAAYGLTVVLNERLHCSYGGLALIARVVAYEAYRNRFGLLELAWI